MSAGPTPGPDATGDPGRRDERLQPSRRPVPPYGATGRPYPPPPPYRPRPRRPLSRTLGIVVVGVLAFFGLVFICGTVILWLTLNSLSSNK